MTAPDSPTERIERWINAHPSRAYAVRFPVDDVCAVLTENKAMADLLGLVGEWGIRFKGTSQDFDYPMSCEQDAREALAEADGERWTLIHRKIGTWKETA